MKFQIGDEVKIIGKSVGRPAHKSDAFHRVYGTIEMAVGRIYTIEGDYFLGKDLVHINPETQDPGSFQKKAESEDPNDMGVSQDNAQQFFKNLRCIFIDRIQ